MRHDIEDHLEGKHFHRVLAKRRSLSLFGKPFESFQRADMRNLLERLEQAIKACGGTEPLPYTWHLQSRRTRPVEPAKRATPGNLPRTRKAVYQGT